LCFVDGKRLGQHGYRNFLHDLDFLEQHDLFLAREFESEPDPEGGEKGGDEGAIDLD